MYRRLFLTLPPNTTLITANRRLAIYLQQFKSKPFVQIQEIQSWIAELSSKDQTTDKELLSEVEESYYWESIVKQSLDSYPLLKVGSTARLAQQAWQHLQLWNKKLDELDPYSNKEVLQFKEWAQKFQLLCKKNKRFSSLEQATQVLRLHQERKLKLPEQLILIGFEEVPPLYQELLNQLGIPLSHFKPFDSPESPKKQIFRVALANTDAEILLMARWAKALINENPDYYIGCIVPELHRLHPAIRSSFNEILKTDFNISAGRPLTQFNMIQSGLRLIALDPKQLELASLSELLRSPYLNASTENSLLAAELDLYLHKKLGSHFSNEAILQALNELNENYPQANFAERWNNFIELKKISVETQIPSAWAQCFATELEAIQWPNQMDLNHEERALLDHWQKFLAQFSLLDKVSEALSREDAIELLNNLAAKESFQIKINPDHHIQILGALEASGLEFDALWLMGLNDRSWPPAAHPNPFIPYHQQREWNMPHASHQREFNYTQKIQERLLQSADTILLSYSEQENELKQDPSPLIKGFNSLSAESLIEKYQLEPYLSKAEQIFALRDIEFIEDEQAPKLTSDEQIRGGSFILKEQAICPFRAFAEIRLKAFSIPQLELGLSAMTRGILVHRALELFWKKIRTQAKLLELNSLELDNEIEQAVAQSIKKQGEHSSFIVIEQTRLRKILSAWIELEKKRPPFKVVATEAPYKIELDQLKLELKVDRIDQLEDGSYLIIDYKTGNTQISSWFEERITEPQLPLYNSLAFKEARAISFAQVKQGIMKFNGLSEDDISIKGIIPLSKLAQDLNTNTWEDLRREWHRHLELTAHEFCEGEARVDPCDPITACSHCELQGLCRINELIQTS